MIGDNNFISTSLYQATYLLFRARSQSIIEFNARLEPLRERATSCVPSSRILKL